MPDILISEIFGPTIQGEGALAGHLTVFVRTGGCDSRCQWCDTLYAVLPEYKSDWTKMSAAQIIEKIEEHSFGKPILVTVSGGNPALQPLTQLLELGQARGHRFALETQGTKSPIWLGQLDFLTISPKPPSSGMKFDLEALRRCVQQGQSGGRAQVSLKVVVFDDADYEFARSVWREFPTIPFYLSVGTEPVARAEGDGEQITRGIEWLIDKAARDGWSEAVILPQIHVLLWGQKRGV
ncbi:7-carboxy-7-deazaguanine synthase QueE [bacterium]|nr:MAG: 7-carboxy-7-deazaguanine synthase QueE [bacterium]